METMTTIDIVAHTLGVFYAIIGLSMLIRPGAYRDMAAEFFSSPALCYTGGILALLFGLVVLAFHSEWRGTLSIIVGIVGWLATAKGVVLIIRPEMFEKFSAPLTRSDKSLRIAGLCALLIGFYLTQASYGRY
jgi:uncharacterized protein YjeT (DUF2065 family)